MKGKGKSSSGSLGLELGARERLYRKTYRYLERYYNKVTDQFRKEEKTDRLNPDIAIDKTIWVCWLQGEKAAPRLVQKCIESIRKNKPNGFEVVIITEKNLYDYIRFPEYVMEKSAMGIITRTHMSDLIRMELLYQYGGLWVDATVYCSRKVPQYMCEGDIFAFCWSLFDKSVLKISSWWIYARQGLPIFHDLRNLLFEYWIHETVLKEYYLFHIAFSVVVDNNSTNAACFSNMAYVNNSNPHVLFGKMPFAFNLREWNAINDVSPVHKLSYKRKFIRGDVYNFYMALLDGKLTDKE